MIKPYIFLYGLMTNPLLGEIFDFLKPNIERSHFKVFL